MTKERSTSKEEGKEGEDKENKESSAKCYEFDVIPSELYTLIRVVDSKYCYFISQEVRRRQ